MRDPRYDILFEPVKIGPVTAKNRFYQVPHCNGGGYRDPSAAAEMRRVKSEGGWGVIFTEQVEIHHTSEITPFIELRLWDEDDMPGLVKMADAIHSNGALAGIELAYSGANGPNLYTREVPMGPGHSPILTFTSDPVQARAMDKEDIRNLRHWHKLAYRRAKRAGYDILCLYGAHGFGIVQHFLSPRTNQRTDEYGGSLENRSRLLKELISDARDEVGDTCAIAVRLSLDEMAGEQGFSNAQLRDMVAMHAELPDLWDFAHGTWEACSGTSRFKPEGAQEDLIRGIKQLTPKPVVGVGRFTSADMMVRQVKQGILDFIGAARPSIADPFLPKKVDENRIEDIRECIGCNICVTGDMTMSISRCTQNSSFMEEWRKGWHPERMPAKKSETKVLVVGAGPAGLSAAHRLGLRGYEVALAEAGADLGGRVTRESRLPGLSAWARVRDYRVGQIQKMTNVNVYRDSALSADDILGFGFEHVAIATGATWRRDGVARYHLFPVVLDSAMPVFTPDDLMAGKLPSGHVVLYDDDHYYMGSVLAELLLKQGCRVTYLTPSTKASEWATNTLEQGYIQQRLLESGVDVKVTRALSSVQTGGVTASCTYTGRTEEIACDAVLMVTARLPDESVFLDLKTRQAEWADSGILSVKAIGDAQAPAAIAWATYAGHRYAEELDEPDQGDALPFRREVARVKD
ncbi:FAD-dependent oxidoreductase [Aestuariivirga sp.]|uniref:oxidoreductase n=1 Tax=Aestuariivirga sp. TaxID=2650926 RepID=UPI0039E57FBD